MQNTKITSWGTIVLLSAPLALIRPVTFVVAPIILISITLFYPMVPSESRPMRRIEKNRKDVICGLIDRNNA